MKQKNSLDFKSMRIQAMKYAEHHKMSNEEMREEFAQEYCLAVWLGKHNSLLYHFVDFLRKQYGRNDRFATEGSLAKSFALKNMSKYDERRVLSTKKEKIIY